MTGEADTAHFANEIHSSAERLQNLINDIIKLSELEEDDLQLEFTPLDLYELAKDCAKAMKLPAQKNGVSLVVEGEPMIVNGSKTLLEELFYNLCSNAVRYNKWGGTEIKAAFREKAANKMYPKTNFMVQ